MFISFAQSVCSSLFKRSLLFANLKRVAYLKINTAAAQSERAGLQISQSCVNRLKQIAAKNSFLRITIEGGGCSGFQYSFDLDSEVKSDDICFEKDGAKIVVDTLSLDFLKGATVDYHEELIRSSFRIVDNPQADSKCSCGTSFSVKDS